MYLARNRSICKVSHGCFADVISASSERAISAIIDDEREHAAEKVGEFHSVLKKKMKFQYSIVIFAIASNCSNLTSAYNGMQTSQSDPVRGVYGVFNPA